MGVKRFTGSGAHLKGKGGKDCCESGKNRGGKGSPGGTREGGGVIGGLRLK